MGERRNDNEYVPSDWDFRIAAGRSHTDLRTVQSEESERSDRVTALLRDKTFLDSCDAAMKTLPKNAKVAKLNTRRQARRWLRHKGIVWAAFEVERRKQHEQEAAEKYRQEQERQRMIETMTMDNRPVAENLPHGIAGA